MEPFEKFDPRQPRDDRGRWSSGGGTMGGGAGAGDGTSDPSLVRGFRGREVPRPGSRVAVYRDLSDAPRSGFDAHTSFSVKGVTATGGLTPTVQAHTTGVRITQARERFDRAAHQQAMATGKRGVHSYVDGTVARYEAVDRDRGPSGTGWRRITYFPDVGSYFDADSRDIWRGAEEVVLSGGRMWARGSEFTGAKAPRSRFEKQSDPYMLPLADALVLKAYDPNQPRDERGRWTTGGGGGHGGGTAAAAARGKQGIGVSDAMAVAGSSFEEKHKRAWTTREQYEPDPKAAQAAADYRRQNGLPEPNYGPGGLTNIPASLGRARKVASMALLDMAKRTAEGGEIDAETRAAYEELGKQTKAQLRAMEKAGVRVEYLTKQDIIDRGLDPEGLNPYPTAKAQRDSVAKTGVLMIASLVDYPEAYHPILDSSKGGTYDQFRAVHDYFGHVAVGTGFGRHGEFQAWLSHTSMFTGEARRAASSELHVENSFLATTGQSAPHFSYLMPRSMVDPFDSDGNYRGEQWLERGAIETTSALEPTPDIETTMRERGMSN